MSRKYEKYMVVIEYNNGEKKPVNLAGVNTNDFDRIKSTYHRVKGTYADKAKTVEFVGVLADGEMKTIYTKEITKDVKSELGQDANDIANNISKQLELLMKKQEYHSKMISAMTKKEDIKKHELEDVHKNIKNKEERDKEIIRVGNELGEASEERRWHKEQSIVISKLLNARINNGFINVMHLANVFRTDKYINNKQTLNMKLAEELKLYSEVTIVNQDKQIKELSKSYEKIVIDPMKNMLICYNKAKTIGV